MVSPSPRPSFEQPLAFTLREKIENLGQLFRRDAQAIILDDDGQLAIVSPGAERKVSARRGVFRRVASGD